MLRLLRLSKTSEGSLGGGGGVLAWFVGRGDETQSGLHIRGH